MNSLDLFSHPHVRFSEHTVAWFRFCCRFMRFIIKMQTLNPVATIGTEPQGQVPVHCEWGLGDRGKRGSPHSEKI